LPKNLHQHPTELASGAGGLVSGVGNSAHGAGDSDLPKLGFRLVLEELHWHLLWAGEPGHLYYQ
jgi:hypothetical protein